MRNMNQTEAIIAVLVMILVVACCVVLMDSDESDGAVGSTWYTDGITYKVTVEENGIWIITDNDYQVEVYDYSGTASTVTIPSTITFSGKTYNVTEIGANAFYNCDTVRTVNIPSSVKKIDYSAFQNCDNLTSAVIPSSVTSIGSSAFSSTGISSVYIYKGVSSIGYGAFSDCPNLTSITVESGNSKYATYNGVLYAKDMSTIISCPGGYSGSLNLSGLGVKEIGGNAFMGCEKLTSITLPNTIQSIDIQAFRDSGIRSISIPNSVKTIEESAFYSCPDLQTVSIPYSVTDLGDTPFNHCDSLVSITVASGNGYYSSVDGILFDASKNTLIKCPAQKSGQVVISADVKTIADIAFYKCKNLTSLVLPDSIETIEDYAFNQCTNLQSINCPTSLKTIGIAAFAYCYNIEEFDFSEGLTTIGASAFVNDRFTSITLPSTLTSIGENAFSCTFYDEDGVSVLPTAASSLRGHTYANSTYSKLIRDWEPPKYYDVTFNTNGGSSSVSTMSVMENTDFRLPSYNGTRTGYTFEGWSDGNLTYNAGATYHMSESNISFVAVWEPVVSTSISLSSTQVSLTVGNSETVRATVYPSNTLNKDIRWTSSNSSVAAVDSNGRITATGEGTAVISAIAEDGGAVATCLVNVVEAPIKVTSISLSSTSLNLEVGDDWTLTATVYPSDATNKSVNWSSSNTKVVIVSDGKLKAVGTGTATITATCGDVKKTCTVTVRAEGSGVGTGDADDGSGGESNALIWVAALVVLLIVIGAVAGYVSSSNKKKAAAAEARRKELERKEPPKSEPQQEPAEDSGTERSGIRSDDSSNDEKN